MRRTLIVCCFGSLLATSSGTALALGFGRTLSPTLIGQPLDFSTAVRLGPEETLEPGCVRAEVLAGDHPVAAEQVRVGLQRTGDPAERVVRVTTQRPIDEPVVSVTVTLACGASLSRKFVAFLDPPLVALAQATSSERIPAPTRAEAASPTAPVLTAADAGSARGSAPRAPAPRLRAAARRTAAAAPHASTSPRTDAGAMTRREAQAATRRARIAAAAPKDDGPRLRLESALSPAAAVAKTANAAASAVPPALVAAAAPEPPAVAAAAAAAAAPDAAVGDLQAQLAVERARNQRLEAGLAQLRREAAQQQQRLLELQAWARQAEAGRGADTLVFVLAGLCAVLAVGTGLLWRRLPSRASTRRWWDLTQFPAAAGTAGSKAAGDDAGDDRRPMRGPTERWGFPISAGEPETAPAALAAPSMGSSIGGLEVTTVIDNAWLARVAAGEEAERPPAAIGPAATSRPASIDALIDLDQQVDFFLALGQDDAAIELLSHHLEGFDLAGSLPHLRLLEIHRGRGDSAAFGRVAAAFEQRFGAAAPGWEAAMEQGRGLEDDAALLARLQTLWPMPAEAMKALEASLLQHPRGGDFDAITGRELLFLYGIARDLAEAAPADGVDVLLPLEASPLQALPRAGLSAIAATQPRATQPAPLDFDLSLPALLDDASELRQAV
jgi:hypothetical protein